MPDNSTIGTEDIITGLIDAKEEVLHHILSSSTLIFYDTCMLQYHSKIDDKAPLANYMKSLFLGKKGVLVITQTIYDETSSHPETIAPCNLLITELQANGIFIVLLKEEWVENCLSRLTGMTPGDCGIQLLKLIHDERNHLLNIYKMLILDTSPLKEAALDRRNPIPGNAVNAAFTFIRANRAPKKSVGEKVVLLTMGMLKSLSITLGVKMYFFSEDHGALGSSNTIFKEIGVQGTMFSRSLIPMVDEMLEKGFLERDKEAIRAFIQSSDRLRATVHCPGDQYCDVKIKSKTEWINFFLTPTSIHILR